MTSGGSRRTQAGDRWRLMVDAARGQALRLGDADWMTAADPYAERVESFRAGQRTDTELVDFIARRAGVSASVVEIGAGAGRLALPLADRVAEVLAVEPSPTMADALIADAVAAGLTNLRVLHTRWETLEDLLVDAAFAAHVVYSLPLIEDFVLRVQACARAWCAIVVFAEPPQVRLTPFWPAVFGEQRLPNPHLPQLLEVAWSLGIYPEVSMLEVPIWPLGPAARAINGLRHRLHLVPGSKNDARLAQAMTELLADWGDGRLGPADRAPLKLAIVHWSP